MTLGNQEYLENLADSIWILPHIVKFCNGRNFLAKLSITFCQTYEYIQSLLYLTHLFKNYIHGHQAYSLVITERQWIVLCP